MYASHANRAVFFRRCARLARRAMTDGHSTGSGLGLGLSSARRLVDDFQLTSEVGGGTTVRLPGAHRASRDRIDRATGSSSRAACTAGWFAPGNGGCGFDGDVRSGFRDVGSGFGPGLGAACG